MTPPNDRGGSNKIYHHGTVAVYSFLDTHTEWCDENLTRIKTMLHNHWTASMCRDKAGMEKNRTNRWG